MFSKLLRLFGFDKTTRSHKKSRRRSTALAVEILEERTVPARIIVGNGVGEVPLLTTAIEDANTNGARSNTIIISNAFANQTITVTDPMLITKSVTIIGLGQGPAGTVKISGGNSSSIFAIYNTDQTVNVTINELVLTDGGNTEGNGGAIDAETTARINLENDDFNSNAAIDNGGAVAMMGNNSSLTVTGCNFTSNWAGAVNLPTDATGGAISIVGANSQLTVTQSAFGGNWAIGGDAGGVSGAAMGGAIALSGTGDTLTISQQCSFFANTAAGTAGGGQSDGGAIAITSLQSLGNTISGTTFNNNMSVLNAGGAIYLAATNLGPGAVANRLTLTGDAFWSNEANQNGGAIDSFGGGSLIVAFSAFLGNSTVEKNGGAIASNSTAGTPGAVTLSSDVFVLNKAPMGSGGAVAMPSNGGLTSTWCWYLGNSAGKDGGAIFLGFGTVSSINLSLFQKNFTLENGGSGGAIFAQNALTFGVSNDTFQGNTAATSGGAIAIVTTPIQTAGLQFTATIASSFFQGNAANGEGADEGGGGVFISQNNTNAGNSVTTTVTNSTFYQNTAKNMGGGLFVNTLRISTVTLTSLTVTVNDATDSGGGLAVDAASLRPTVGNSIIAANTAPAGMGPDATGNVTSANFNLIGFRDASSNGWNGANDQVGPVMGVAINPLLNFPPTQNVPGFFNGQASPTSATPVLTLAAGSPAINRGNAAALVNTPDQTGMNRPAAVAIGAYNPNGVAPPAPPRVGMINPGPQNSTTGSSVDLAITTNNPNGDPLVYVAQGLPAGLSINEEGQITGTVAYGAASSSPYIVTVMAIDTATGDVAKVQFNWTVASYASFNPGTQVNQLGDSVSLSLQTWLDGGPVAYTATGLPDGLTEDPTTGEITGSINDSDATGIYSVTATATDTSTSFGKSQTFDWIVNSPTVSVNNPGNETNLAGDSVNLSVSASDTDDGTLSYSAENLPAGLSINSSTGQITGTIANNAAGNYNVIVEADDNTGASSSVPFTWTVNLPTVYLSNPGFQSNNVGDTVNVSFAGGDSDSNPLTYSATDLPAGLSISSSTGAITGTVAAGAGGLYLGTVTATDSSSGASANESFVWYVTPPTVTLSNPGLQTNLTGESADVTFTSSDSDGSPLSFAAVNLPAGLSINTSTGEITGTISSGASGVYWVTVTATDSSAGVDTQTFEWIVNSPTVSLSNPGDQTNLGGDSVNLSLSASDTDDNPLSFNSSHLPSGLSINSSTGQITGTIANYVDGNFWVTVTATDTGTGASTSVVFTWTVNPPTITVSNPGNQTNLIGDTVDVTYSSSDSDGYPLTFSATGLPAGLTINSSTGAITGTMADGAVGTYDVAVTATDTSSGVSDTVTFTWTVNQIPTVTSDSPSSGSTAGGTFVAITGSGFTGATTVEFGDVAATYYTVNSATSITAISPAESAGTVDITVTTPAGMSATSSADQFTYNTPAPTVTSDSPSSGPTSGGTSVNITGSGFTGATTVEFNGVTASNFTVYSDSDVMATSPAESAGTVDITVTTPAGTSATSSADHFTYNAAAPTVTADSPSSGPTSGGTSVNITGTGFTGATTVDFNGVAASFTVNSSNSITATSPSESAGTVDITVTTPAGTSATSSADHFTYNAAAPTVTGDRPSSGPTSGGTSVNITGSGFTGATAVEFNGVTASNFTVYSNSDIMATSPAESAGTVDITVTTPAGTSATSSADHFTYNAAAPTVTGDRPSSGPTSGGTSVNITGSGFTGATAVEFNGVTASNFTVYSDSDVMATSPAESAGTVDITVTTPAGTSATSSADKFTYTAAAPTVTADSPSSGPTSGGTSVNITGSGFTGATAVEFNGVTASNFTVYSDNDIMATSPAESAGTVDITVTTPAATSATSSADKFTYTAAAPTITGDSPSSGPTSGGTSVNITGSGFTGATAVEFNGVTASNFTVYSNSDIMATSPAESAGTVDITVTTPAGTSATSSADKFTYTAAAPTVTADSPSSGPTSGGTSVNITGSGFTGATAVEFNGVTASNFTVYSNSDIMATSPAESAGTVDITVTTPAGTSATSSADKFTYTAAAPTVTGDSPSSGPTSGGTAVNITGSGFTGATAVEFNGVTASNFTVYSDNDIMATSPAESAGTVDITVTTPAATSATSSADKFTYTAAAPTITGDSPSSGPTAGGTSVAITGCGFTGATAVDFNGVTASNVSVYSDSFMTATSPSESAGTVDITVTTSAGTSATSSADKFTYVAVSLPNPGTQTNTDGDTVDLSLSATDSASNTLSYSAKGLPAGLSINSSTGVISGSVDDGDSIAPLYTVTVTATDSTVSPSAHASQTFQWNVNSLVTMTNPGTETNSEGDTVGLPLSATDSAGNALDYTAVNLPQGLTLDYATGVISGEILNGASLAGPYTVTVTATDSMNAASSASQTFLWTVNPLVTLTNPGAETNADGDTVYVPLSASDSAGDAVSYSAIGLPAGLSIGATTGIISGTVSLGDDVDSPYSVTVSATDDVDTAAHASQTYQWTVTSTGTITVTLPALTTQTSLEETTVNLNLSATDSAGNSLVFQAADLPPGLTIDDGTGIISGTINDGDSAYSPYTVTVSATDSTNPSVGAFETFQWNVNPLVTLTNPGAESNAEGDTVYVTPSATDSAGNSLTFTAINLPAGLSINQSTGVISGIVAAGDAASSPYTVNVTATDSMDTSSSASQSFQWVVTATGAITVNLAQPANQTNLEEVYVDLPVSATDSSGNQLIYAAYNLPPGLAIDPATGVISGTILNGDSAMGSFAVTVTASDSTNASVGAFQTFEWIVNPGPINLYSPGNQTDLDGETVSQQLTGTDLAGGTLSWSSVGLPSGLTLGTNGLVSGTITRAPGQYAVTVTATDGAYTATEWIVWTVDALEMNNPGNQSNFDGDAVTLQLSATNDLGDPLTYAVAGSALPAGLNLDGSSGIIYGTVASNADTNSPYFVSVVATDSVSGASVTQSFYWYVSQVTVTLDNPGAQTNCDGDSVAIALPRADSANNPLAFTATNLPSGLTIDPGTGEITGTIDSSDASYVVTVTATDTNTGATASQSFNWNIVPILISNPGNQSNFDGDTVDVTLQTETTYTVTDTLIYSATGLPSGLTVNGSGVITGTLASDADLHSPYSAVVTVTDVDARISSSQSFTWNVTADPTIVSLANPGNESNVDGDSVNIPLIGMDSAGDQLAYSEIGLPAGLSVVGSQIVGNIASNADAASPYFVTVTATDTFTGVSASQTLAWYVDADVTTVSLADPGNESNTDGNTVDLTLTGSDSAGDPLTYSATNLPAGLSVVGNKIMGTIAGDAYEAGPYAVTLTATDITAGVSANQQITWFCSAGTSESMDVPSETVVTSSALSCNFGQSITLTAAVTVAGDGTPTGRVTFMDGQNNLGTRILNGAGQATITISGLGIGSHNITAVYSGDGTYAGSTSAVLAQVVNGGYATGKVWVDANSNGLLDPGETGLAGVTVNLLNVRGVVVTTTTTNALGIYSFSGLIPNTWYAVQVVRPNGYVFTYFQSSTNATLNSFTGSDGVTNYFQVPVGYAATLNSGLINTAGLTANTVTGPGAVPGNSTYSFVIALSGQVHVSWAIRIVSPVNPPANTAAVSGALRFTYSAATNTTVESIPLTFGNMPADVFLSACINGQVVSSEEIYVVQVSVAVNQASLRYSGVGGARDIPVATGATDSRGTALKSVLSGVPANQWTATVTLIGPGNNLGVSQINVGFIQHVTIRSLSAQYANIPAGQPAQLVNSLQGRTLLDVENGAGPWYDSENIAIFNNATADVNSKTIGSDDSPLASVPLTFDQLRWPQVNALALRDANGQPDGFNSQMRLSGISLIEIFTLDVAAVTTDTANGANNSYWAEAQANWTFNGSGTVAPFNPVTNNVLWTGSAASGTTGNQFWSAIVAPTLENTNGPIANDVSGTFSPAP